MRPFRPEKLKLCVPGEQCRRRIRGRGSIADVSAQSADIADLRTADLTGRLRQRRNTLQNHGVFPEAGKAGQGADPERSVGRAADPPQGLNTADADQFRIFPLSVPDLDQHIASAGDDAGIRVSAEQTHCLLGVPCLKVSLYIVHADPSLLGIRPAFNMMSLVSCSMSGRIRYSFSPESGSYCRFRISLSIRDCRMRLVAMWFLST